MQKIKTVNTVFLHVNRLLVMFTSALMLVSVVFEPLWYLRAVGIFFTLTLISLGSAALLAYGVFFASEDKQAIKRFYLHFLGLLFIVLLYFAVEFLAQQF